MIRVKICGIRDEATARAIGELSPFAIGLNFYEKSVRHVPEPTAAAIVRSLRPGIEAWGVFVNHPVAEVRRIAQACGLHAVQLHGDEPPEHLAELRPLKVIRAFRVGEAGLDEMGAYLEQCRQLGALPAACLIDARVEGAFGGTGHVAPWDLLAAEARRSQWPPLILAGGLTPANVRAGIRVVQPWGVDVAGGVESRPGVKDLERVRAFVSEARNARSS